MKEGNPSDKYSKAAYEAGLKQLAQNEEAVETHPLQEEVTLHEELRKGTDGPYALSEEEAAARARLAEETGEFRKKVDAIKQDLWRQLSNAQTEAIQEDNERESRKAAEIVLPKINEIEATTHQRLENAPGNLSVRAHVYGRAVLEVAEEAKRKITDKPRLSPTMIRAIFETVQEGYKQFAAFAGNVLSQDKYGHPLSET